MKSSEGMKCEGSEERLCVSSTMFPHICCITITLLHTAFCMDVPAPVNLSISSQYFVHVLSWSMGPGSPEGVHYTVRMQRLGSGSEEILVKGCEKVTSPLRCNLTKAFSDPEEIYYISVTAALGNRTSAPANCRPFKPILNTTLELPQLSVTARDTSLLVSLTAPSPELHSIYSSEFHYRLMITREDGSTFDKDTEGLKNVTLTDLAPGRRYCVTVSIIDRKSPSRPPVCDSTPQTANIPDLLILVILCVLVVCVIIISRLILHFYLKEDLPAVLSSFQTHEVQAVLIIAAESISNLTVETDSLQKMKRNREEHEEIEGETEEGVTYERLATHLTAEDNHTSSPSILSKSSGSALIMKPSPETHAYPTSSTHMQCDGWSEYEDGSVTTTDLRTPVGSQHLPRETSPLLNSSSVFPAHVAQEDSGGEEAAELNLFSVTLGRIVEKLLTAETCSDTDELELLTDDGSHQTRFKTAATCCSGSAAHSSEPLESHISDSEDNHEDYSGYLSRN